MSQKKVLVADDEIHIIYVVAVKLRNNGYEVITAENGAEALELALEETVFEGNLIAEAGRFVTGQNAETC